MKIKVSATFVDGDALIRAIHNYALKEAHDRFPIEEGNTDEDIQLIQEHRGQVYDVLYEAAIDCVNELRLKTYLVIEYDYKTKQARIVGATDD